MIVEIDSNRDQISRLCRQFGVKRLEVFGSAATEAFDATRSDIDFVIDFGELQGQSLFKRYFGLKEELESLFGRPVDLVMADAMKNPFFIESVNKTRQPVYAAEIPKLLEDIRDAADFIREVTRGRTLDDYSRDRLLRQAVERNFEIAGEAVRRLALHDAATAARIGDYQKIIAFRNILIHGYDLVNHALVWDTIQSELVILLRETEKLLGESKSDRS